MWSCPANNTLTGNSPKNTHLHCLSQRNQLWSFVSEKKTLVLCTGVLFFTNKRSIVVSPWLIPARLSFLFLLLVVALAWVAEAKRVCHVLCSQKRKLSKNRGWHQKKGLHHEATTNNKHEETADPDHTRPDPRTSTGTHILIFLGLALKEWPFHPRFWTYEGKFWKPKSKVQLGKFFPNHHESIGKHESWHNELGCAKAYSSAHFFAQEHKKVFFALSSPSLVTKSGKKQLHSDYLKSGMLSLRSCESGKQWGKYAQLDLTEALCPLMATNCFWKTRTSAGGEKNPSSCQWSSKQWSRTTLFAPTIGQDNQKKRGRKAPWLFKTWEKLWGRLRRCFLPRPFLVWWTGGGTVCLGVNIACNNL